VKSFACGDVVPGCDARWVCSTEDEVLVNVAAHAASDHGLTELPDGLVDSVRRSIVTVS
jgi:predicted small metal-binding protein